MLCGGSALVVIGGVEAGAEPNAEADVPGPDSNEWRSAAAILNLFRRVLTPNSTSQRTSQAWIS